MSKQKQRANRKAVLKKRKAEEAKFVITRKAKNYKDIVNEAFTSTKKDYNNNLQHLAQSCSGCHKQNFRQLCLLFIKDETILDKKVQGALWAMALHHNKFIRQIENWKPKTYNNLRQISDLARHLFAQYDVPLFMDKVWYDSRQYTEIHKKWFIHVAQGQNIRKAEGLPTTLTKKEAHFFLEAPRDFDVLTAIRYGQILNLQGKESFVRSILTTRIAADFQNEAFWFSVIRWLLQNPMLEHAQYAPIIDYIHNQRFVNTKLDENGKLVPLQPNFCIKGREPETLLNQVRIWHNKLGKDKSSYMEWKASGIAPLYKEVGKDNDRKVYTIEEITNSKALTIEGKTMHHCVSSYARTCFQGLATIWSLLETTWGSKKNLLTIKVEPVSKVISEVRGKYNAKPETWQMNLVREWGRKSGLSISQWVT